MSQSRSRAAAWSRTACAMALLFATLPVAGRLILGTWGFDGAPALSFLCFCLAVYFYFRSRKLPTIPDPATYLEEALELANAGEVEQAIAVLTETIRLSPWVWQALRYRGELYLHLGQSAEARADFAEALRLAPDEPQLQTLPDCRGSDEQHTTEPRP